MIQDSYFFSDLIEANVCNEKFLSFLEEYSNQIQKQVYAIYRALPTKNTYNYKEACVLLIPHKKIIFVNFDNTNEKGFQDYKLDFIEDLGYLSEKFGYKDKLNRPRTWMSLFADLEVTNEHVFDFEQFNEDSPELQRKIEILSSLIIGSINDPNKVTLDVPDTLIKKIKNKIILYDGNQSSFIYQDVNPNKVIRIQGLAGTGKTELLIQKIREKYVNEKNSKIVYACYNQVLCEDMKKRIPALFDFMKVDEQIKINERLWIMRAWGSGNDRNTGICSYICSAYNIPFTAYRRYYELEDFASDILQHIKKLKEKKQFTPCFDYIFLDEGQDFKENFINLCEEITAKKLFIAGDVFQNIFDTEFIDVEADYVLNKCYRTDPKTLMFAHSVGMGLYEKPIIRWLEDKEWALCGYKVDKINGMYHLSRKPIRRFEDIEDSNSNILIKPSTRTDMIDTTINSILEIQAENPDLQPDDIAIVFVESSFNTMCEIADKLEDRIFEKFHWETNIGYQTKNRNSQNKIFISNSNNIKGLEFPFVITIATGCIYNMLDHRNSIYMALTRSFIKSYFIINNEIESNVRFMNIYNEAINSIVSNKAIIFPEPTEDDKKIAKQNLGTMKLRNNREAVYKRIQQEFNMTDDMLDALKTLTKTMSYDKSIDDESFYQKLIPSVKNLLR